MKDWGEETLEQEIGEEDSELPSKSQLKRESVALQGLAAELVDLSREQLTTLALPEPLLDAVRAAAGIHSHGARKRQLKFIAGMLRKIDVEAIREGLARLKNQSAHAVREHHRLERWRDALLEQGDEALGALLEACPRADRQRVRQLVRNARQEASALKPPKSARLLFKYLRELFAQGE